MDYQKNTEHIGSSDIGILILSGFERGKGFQLKNFFFGEDGTYSAYIVNGQTHIPDHYELICEFNTWMRIYDDDHLFEILCRCNSGISFRGSWMHYSADLIKERNVM